MMMRWNKREKKATLRKRFVIHSTSLLFLPLFFFGDSILSRLLPSEEKKIRDPCLHLAAAGPITQIRNN
jgi:hypothetical protein